MIDITDKLNSRLFKKLYDQVNNKIYKRPNGRLFRKLYLRLHIQIPNLLNNG